MATKLQTWGSAQLGASNPHGRNYSTSAGHIDVTLFSIALPGDTSGDDSKRRRLRKAFVSPNKDFRIYVTDDKDKGASYIVDVMSGHFVETIAWQFKLPTGYAETFTHVEAIGEVDFVAELANGFKSFVQADFQHPIYGDVRGTLFFTNQEATAGIATAIDASGAVIRWRFTV